MIDRTDLIGDLAGLLYTGSDAADELGLLAVAAEVKKRGAPVGAEGRYEALELEID